jgi:hypothetical protein
MEFRETLNQTGSQPRASFQRMPFCLSHRQPAWDIDEMDGADIQLDIEALAQLVEDIGPLVVAADAALDALRSYQYGNSSTELAEEIAAALKAALDPVKLGLIRSLNGIA